MGAKGSTAANPTAANPTAAKPAVAANPTAVDPTAPKNSRTFFQKVGNSFAGAATSVKNLVIPNKPQSGVPALSTDPKPRTLFQRVGNSVAGAATSVKNLVIPTTRANSALPVPPTAVSSRGGCWNMKRKQRRTKKKSRKAKKSKRSNK